MKTFTQQALEEYSNLFGCTHHAAQCSGDCKNREKAFLTSKLEEQFKMLEGLIDKIMTEEMSDGCYQGQDKILEAFKNFNQNPHV